MSRLVLMHAADLDLDAPFEGIGRTPPPVAAALRDASLAAWDALVQLALARRVDAVLLAGGLAAGLERGARAHARLRDGIARLASAGTRVCIGLGDRDPSDGFAAMDEWPSDVTVFERGRAGQVPFSRDGTVIATVHGISSAPHHRDGELAAHFVRPHTPGVHVAMLHARLSGAAVDDAASAYRLADLQAAGMDYWALGAGHALEYVSSGAPWVVYPGTPQGRGFAADECGAKGVVLIEIADRAIARVDFEPVDRIRCLRVELRDAVDATALVRTLTASAEALRERNAGRALVLEARIDGAPAVHRALRRPDACAELLRGLRRAADAWDPFVWWATARPLPAQRRPFETEQPDDLAAEVLRCRAALAGDPPAAARFLARRFEPLRDAWTADLERREAEDLLDDAAALAVTALRRDEP